MRINGRRGSCLLAVGVMHVLIGVSYAAPELANVGPGTSASFLLALGVPLPVAGAAWVLTGLVAVVAAFVRPPGRDGFGFVAAVAMQSAWVTVFLWSWAFGGYSRGWLLAAVFACLAILVWGVSGMVSATTVRQVRPPVDRPTL